MKRVLVCIVAAMVVLMAALGGCGGTATVATDGSTSMERVIGALGEAFTNDNADIKFTYNPTGSSSGIAAVLAGRCDIGLSSRALKENEIEAGLTETLLAYDGIAVIVHPDNPVRDLTVEQIAAIYTGEIVNWSALGGADAQIVVIGREAGSGTRDGFESITGTEDSCVYRQELASTGDVVSTVSANPAAIGYCSLASVKSNVAAVSVDGTAPSEGAVQSGEYALKRPYMLITRSGEELSAHAALFMQFATSGEASGIISAQGAIPVA
ncbi:MAG: phosphate ABC transporter substrate-binding protein [Clostridia bacterium]|nr:phosphate ABC transporter substrate-binding protein [Clostridia bacterium]